MRWWNNVRKLRRCEDSSFNLELFVPLSYSAESQYTVCDRKWFGCVPTYSLEVGVRCLLDVSLPVALR